MPGHPRSLGERFAGRFLQVLRPAGLVVYGSPSTGAKDALAGFNPVYMESIGGFSRTPTGYGGLGLPSPTKGNAPTLAGAGSA